MFLPHFLSIQLFPSQPTTKLPGCEKQWANPPVAWVLPWLLSAQHHSLSRRSKKHKCCPLQPVQEHVDRKRLEEKKSKTFSLGIKTERRVPSLNYQVKEGGFAPYHPEGKKGTEDPGNHSDHINQAMLSFKIVWNLDNFVPSLHRLHFLLELTSLSVFHPKREMAPGDVGMVPST